VAKAIEYPSRLAVVTGGEPLMHDLSVLCHRLRQAGFKTHLETSGSYPLTGDWDWICFSPKKFKQPLAEIYGQADELKVVVYNMSDFDWAVNQAKRVSPSCLLFLQPEWGKSTTILPHITAFIEKNPGWRISLQVHKYMGIP